MPTSAQHSELESVSTRNSEAVRLPRRALVIKLTLAAASVSLLNHCGESLTELQPLRTEEPVAKALLYVERADPALKQNCANCRLQLALSEGQAGWLGCAMFLGKKVTAAGWCSRWEAV